MAPGPLDPHEPLGASEIARHVLAAGFTGPDARTAVAVALAESGGRPGAHADTAIEDSRGLFQINVEAHPQFAGVDLYDPAVNARAAHHVFTQAGSWQPWSVTHADRGQPYLDYLDEADAALALAGSPAEESRVHQFLQLATAQEGDAYVFGAQAAVTDPDPDAFDCAELVQWAAGRVGVEVPDGSWLQYLHLKEAGALISVEEAARTPGALVFRFSAEPVPGGGRPDGAHVAISLGDGRTIEAKGRAYGVVTDDIEGRGFEYAAVIPGISDTAAGPWSGAYSLPTGAVLSAAGPDSDGDGLSDALESAHGLDPARADTDSDGASDGYEVVRMGTDPTMADTDRDGLSDTAEASFGTDALVADTDGDGLLDGDRTGAVDTDGDRIGDELEIRLGLQAGSADSDGDGVSDAMEIQGGFDPLDRTDSPFAATAVAEASGGPATSGWDGAPDAVDA